MPRHLRRAPPHRDGADAQTRTNFAPGDAFLQPPPYPVTYKAFLDWADEDIRAECVDGRIVMTSPANLRHQLVDQLLIAVVSTFVEIHRLGLSSCRHSR